MRKPQEISLGSTGWRENLVLAYRRFDAWWEGYDFDRERELAAISGSARISPQSERAGAAIAAAIWGEGRSDPGDAAWSMRHARLLGLGARSRVVVLGAGGGGVLKDLKQGAGWRLKGYAHAARCPQSGKVVSYDKAIARLNKSVNDGGLCFFDLHRDPDPMSLAVFAAELVKQNAPFAFVDFAVSKPRMRLRSCFAGELEGQPRAVEEYAELLSAAGFVVGETSEETRAFLPLISRGWAHWKEAYRAIAAANDLRLRSEGMISLSRSAHVWAERFDALKAGHLKVVRISVRKKR